MRLLPGFKSGVDIIESLDKKGAALLLYLLHHEVAFLLSDFEDPECIIVATTTAFCTLTQYSEEEVLGKNCRFLQGPDTAVSEVKIAVMHMN